MKPFIYLLLISQTFFLSACQANEMYPEFIFEKDTLQLDHKTIPTSTIPSYVDNTKENAMSESPPVTPSTPADEEVNEEEHLQIETTTKDETSPPVLPEVEEEVPSLTQPSQTTQTLYLENGPGRAYYETKPYLPSSDKITISNGEEDFATLQFKTYKIVEDQNGSGRQGIALYFIETNISDEKIQVGLAGHVLNPVLNHSVFYQEAELKKMPADEEWLKFADANYIENQHVDFTPTDAKVSACSEPKTLKPGKSRECYVHYSYPGPGEYLINQAINPSYQEFVSFIITVE